MRRPGQCRVRQDQNNGHPMPLKNCPCTLSLQRSTSSSPLKLKACFKRVQQRDDQPNGQGLGAWAAGLAEASAGQVRGGVQRGRSFDGSTCANRGASDDSTSVHGARVARTASGWCISIITSWRARKKLSMAIGRGLQNS
jgi:hypothetical protein